MGTRGVSVTLSGPPALTTGLVCYLVPGYRGGKCSPGVESALLHVCGQRKQWHLYMLVLPVRSLVQIRDVLCMPHSNHARASVAAWRKSRLYSLWCCLHVEKACQWDEYSQNVTLWFTSHAQSPIHCGQTEPNLEPRHVCPAP